MERKLIKVGTSTAVTLPKKFLEDFGLKSGDKIIVEVDKKTKSFIVKPSFELSKADLKIAQLALNFINRYREDFESLAHK